MKTALIFGVTGQDGSYLAELLLNKKYRVYGLARRSSNNNLHRIEHLLDSDNFKLIKGDITDFSSVLNAIREACLPNEIYNLAAMSHVHVSFTEPFHTFETVAKGAMNVFEAVGSINNYQPNIYQASSSEMFGSAFSCRYCGPNLSEEDGGNIFQDERTPFAPQSPYALAKVTAHKYAQFCRQTYGMRIWCGILFNHESPRRGDQFVTKKITNYIRNLCDNSEKVYELGSLKPIYHIWPDDHPKLKLGNIDARRDWGYAPDYVEAMWLMLQSDTPDDYVVATGETHSVQEFLECAFNSVELDWQDFVEIDRTLFRPSDVPYLLGDSSKIKSRLGWEPKVNFEQLVSIMLDQAD